MKNNRRRCSIDRVSVNCSGVKPRGTLPAISVEDVWKTVLGRDEESEESEESRDAEESISASSRRCRQQQKKTVFTADLDRLRD